MLYCKRCGAQLPEGRAKFCYDCKPYTPYPWRKKAADDESFEKPPKPKPPPPKPEYSWEETAARATARGMSYGKFMVLLETGQPLPPLLHSVRWPRGSKHKNEEQLPDDPTAPNTGTATAGGRRGRPRKNRKEPHT